MTDHVRILAGRVDRGAGSHVYHQQLTRRLAARGYRVSLICFEAVAEVLDCAEVFEVQCVPYHEKPLVWPLASLLQHRHCTRTLLDMKLPCPDIVIAGEHLLLKSHFQAFSHIPWIYLPHSLVADLEIQSYNFPPLMNWVSTQVYTRLQRWALRHANRTLRFTRHGCDILTARYGRSSRARFSVNPLGIDLPTDLNRAPVGSIVNLLSVGRLVPGKRVDLALKSLANLMQYDWRFDIVGTGPSRDQLERQVSALGLQDRVFFHGFQPNPSSWYRKADLLLFPSRLENSPITILEAMAHGVPCLAMHGDGKQFFNANSEVIRSEVNGFLADSDQAFQGQLEHILRQPGILATAGAESRSTVEQYHTWEAHLDRYDHLFDELLNRSGPNAKPFTLDKTRT